MDLDEPRAGLDCVSPQDSPTKDETPAARIVSPGRNASDPDGHRNEQNSRGKDHLYVPPRSEVCDPNKTLHLHRDKHVLFVMLLIRLLLVHGSNCRVSMDPTRGSGKLGVKTTCRCGERTVLRGFSTLLPCLKVLLPDGWSLFSEEPQMLPGKSSAECFRVVWS